MNPEEQSSVRAAEARTVRIAQVLATVAAQRQSGGQLSDQEVCAAHPDLMPELKEQLQHLQFVIRAREQADQGLAGKTQSAPPAAKPHLGAEISADSFGGYQILREIHRGGQGIVYQALQKSTRRKVALKVMKEGPFASAADQVRFEREVEILGQLNHPNIVAIHDSGQAAGCHYFVMNYISGQPLDVWMTGEAHSIEDTLSLFMKICSAVNAAHLRGITHRDLKPGNIRVDANGEPHVLDFGLAKVAHSADQASLMTMTGQFMGSLPWASPEQAEGVPSKIDIRTDVYSLGVILYQMLTGAFPYEVIGNMRDVLDRIMRTEPQRPSAVRKRINDEVETIVLKCLQKERERRYQSAGELARDIGHYLAGEPIEAKRDSAVYVLRKYLRKHRATAGVAAGFVVVITAGLVLLLTFWRLATVAADQARHQAVLAQQQTELANVAREEAEQRRKETQQVADFQAAQLAEIDLKLMGRRMQADVMADARTALERAGVGDSEVADELAHLAGLLEKVNWTNVALKTVDANVLARALDAIETRFESQPLVKAQLLLTSATTFTRLGLFDRAMAPQTEALGLWRALLGDDDPHTANAHAGLGTLLAKQGKLGEAEPYLRAALDIRRRTLGEDHRDTLDSISDLGALFQEQGKLADAEALLREALSRRRRVMGDDHPDTLLALGSLGVNFGRQCRLEEGELYLREALEKSRIVLGDEHPTTLALLGNLTYTLQNKPEEVEPYLRELLAKRRAVLGDEHPATLNAMNNMACLLRDLDKPAEAEPLFRQILGVYEKVLPPGNWRIGSVSKSLGACLARLQRFQEAEAALLRAHAIYGGAEGVPPIELRGNFERLIGLYDAWHAAEPDQGHDQQAAEWQAKLAEWQASTQPANAGGPAGRP